MLQKEIMNVLIFFWSIWHSKKEQEAYRPPANPYLNAPKPQNSAGMFKDNGDNRS